MQETGRTPIGADQNCECVQSGRQASDDKKRETRRSLMDVVAKATDVMVKRAPVANKGELPQTRWEYHERINTRWRKEE